MLGNYWEEGVLKKYFEQCLYMFVFMYRHYRGVHTIY